MRSYDEMFHLIIQNAEEDERIRAMTMEGSNSTKGAVRDAYSDFDITIFVTDVRDFSNDRDYMNRFGEVLILQRPDDWYKQPYDYNGKEKYTFLTQYRDGNRIDLTVIDISKMSEQSKFSEPRVVLVNKDHFTELSDITSQDDYLIQKPSEFEYFNTCNEFRWLSNYATKGLCRKELYYVKHIMDVYMMDMFMKMMNWKVGVDNDFSVTTGVYSKYLSRFLSEDEMNRFAGIFANGEYDDLWEKLFVFYDYFAELAKYVGEALGFFFDETETKAVREFMENRGGSYEMV
ncbi:MAG: aminoglycoside 6-adenylyltransferase [Clostridia bacterium]|nr:aminoglycoside 6-adenylyltransferase [Clostridia bacterium]